MADGTNDTDVYIWRHVGSLQPTERPLISPEGDPDAVFAVALHALGQRMARYFASLPHEIRVRIRADFERHRRACLACELPLEPRFLIERLADARDTIRYRE